MTPDQIVASRIDARFADAEREWSKAAASYARRGWPIFALGKNKRPLFGSHGFKDARIVDTWPSCQPMAIATGAAKLVVLDVDPCHGGDESLRALVLEHGDLPITLRARTRSGGTHIYFAGETKSSIGMRAGVDVKSRGGYVVAPPTSGYEWECFDVELAPVPAWLTAMLAPTPRKPAAPPQLYVSTFYAKAALTKGWNEIATAPDGARNSVLNRVVFGWALRLRQVPDEKLVEIALDAARAAGLSEREALKTIAKSALVAGRSK